MANSSCIREWKNIIMSELQNDSEIVQALGLDSGEDEESLVYTRLFPFYFLPDTQEDVKTYILVEIDIHGNRNSRNMSEYNAYAYPVITFTILSHQWDIRMKKSGISAVRTDYIAELIDNKYNGRSGFGIGKIQLSSSTAGNLNEKYKFRQLVFQCLDFNNGICGKF
jgi:hypothetical protein